MATNAAAIKASILAKLEATGKFDTTSDWSPIIDFIGAFAEGLYPELQKLQDTAGTPPSPSHV